jgi:hypothetical protein
MLFDPNWKKQPDPEISIEPWRQLLLDAADYIEVNGWCQKTVQDYEGRVCAVGAMLCVLPQGNKNFDKAFTKLQSAVGLIPIWNDNCNRTKEQVIAKMREVANAV